MDYVKVAANGVQFLQRVEMKGSEVMAWSEVVKLLSDIQSGSVGIYFQPNDEATE